MHIGSNDTKSKSEAMFFPSTLKQAKLEVLNDITPEELILPNDKKVHFMHKFKCLGSTIIPLLNKDV